MEGHGVAFFSSCTAVADCDREELAGGWDRKRVRKGCNIRGRQGEILSKDER